MLTTSKPLILLIEEAEAIAGGLRPLARLLDMNASNLIAMKKGERPANWRVRGSLRAILGEDPARAFMAAMTEDLEKSEKADEKKAAESFKQLLAAFPASTGGNGWFRLLHLIALQIRSRLHNTINSPLRHLRGYAVLNPQPCVSH